MPSSEIDLYLPYIAGIAAIWLLIFVVTEVKKWRMTRRRERAIRMVFRTSSVPQEKESKSGSVKARAFPAPFSAAIGRPEPIPAERRQKWEEARELARGGWNIDQIARHLSIGRDETKIALQVNPSSMDAEKPSASLSERPARVRRLAEEGVSYEEIGRRLGMSIQEVRLILRL